MAATNATLVWKADAWKAAAIPALNTAVAAAAAVMADQAVRNMGTSGGGVMGSGSKIDTITGRSRGRLKLKGPNNWISSQPGGFPGVRSSNLRNSIVSTLPGAVGNLKAAFGTAVPYGRYLEFGAVVTPKRAKFLRFMLGDQVVFTKRCVIQARPWIVRSALMAQQRASNVFVRVANARLRAAGLSK